MCGAEIMFMLLVPVSKFDMEDSQYAMITWMVQSNND